jgi:hypothetical protein
MSSCEKDQCSACLWKRFHSCVYDKTPEQCKDTYDHEWCGGQGARVSTNSWHSTSTNDYSSTPASCGACGNCMLISAGSTAGCYSGWTEAQCTGAGAGYQWCGGGSGGTTTISCCNPATTPVDCKVITGTAPTCPTGYSLVNDCSACSNTSTLSCCNRSVPSSPVCTTYQDVTACPTGSSPVSSCTLCQATSSCANPYYGSDTSGAGCGLGSILPNNLDGLKKWLQVFPVLDPGTYNYQATHCNSPDPVNYRPIWGAGCFMFGQGGLNGLTAFLKAAAMFPGFCNGPDPRKNLIELAIFFGNVSQETGDPKLGGLIMSKEGDSTMDSLFGKGAIQLSYALNYQMATLGVQTPADFAAGNSLAGPIADPCNSSAKQYSNDLGACWTQCAAATPAMPPHGAGYNFCAKPWLASGYNDLVNPPVLDPLPAWTSAIWYWMNVPIGSSSAAFHNLGGDVTCATAHNLVQDPQYNCGDWCPVLAIAQVGCPSCCTQKQTALNDMTVNRIGHFVQIAGILGLPEAQGTSANNLYCMLLNTCITGGGVAGPTTCPSGTSYSEWLLTGLVPVCGNVQYTTGPPSTAPPCKAVTGNTQGVTDAQCASCQIGNPSWPCTTTGLCQWSQ